jgi:hypothetical protein
MVVGVALPHIPGLSTAFGFVHSELSFLGFLVAELVLCCVLGPSSEGTLYQVIQEMAVNRSVRGLGVEDWMDGQMFLANGAHWRGVVCKTRSFQLAFRVAKLALC